MSDEDNQMKMFDIPEDPKEWELEWVGMPEYLNKRITPYKEIIVRFANEFDYKEFQELILQNMTAETKSIWHPKLEIGVNAHLRYADKETIKKGEK